MFTLELFTKYLLTKGNNLNYYRYGKIIKQTITMDLIVDCIKFINQ